MLEPRQRLRYPRSGGRSPTNATNTREAGAPVNSPIPVSRSAVAGLGLAGSSVGVAGRVVPEVSLVGCWRTPLRLPHDWTGKMILYFYPGADWSPDGGNSSRMADALEHQAFDRLVKELLCHRVIVRGVSSESSQAQQQCVRENCLYRLKELWRDPDLLLARELGLHTFTAGGIEFHRRQTLFVKGGRVEKWFYPVVDPDRCAAQVAEWLKRKGRW
jgi:peroxiredoxin